MTNFRIDQPVWWSPAAPAGVPWRTPARGTRRPVGLEVGRRHVVKDEAGRAEPGVRGARFREPLPPRLLRIGREAALDGPVGGRRDVGLLVFTVRTYGTRQLHGPPLVRNFSF